MMTRDQIRDLAERLAQSEKNGRVSDAMRAELQRIDREETFSSSARDAFQDLLARAGIPTAHPIRIPLNSEPYWFRQGQPLAGFQSSAQLIESADVVVIGAGLVGASAAYHLADHAKQHRVVVLDQGDPGGEASGRNGGNFELIPENSVGIYEGLARERLRFLLRVYPSVPTEVLRAESER